MATTSEQFKKRAYYYTGLTLAVMFLPKFIYPVISNYMTWAGSFAGNVTSFLTILLILLIADLGVRRMMSV